MLPPGDVWPYWETFLAVKTWGVRVLLHLGVEAKYPALAP